MARTFGKRSYAPENLTFFASGCQPSGLPWSAVRNSLSQNILIEASDNPSTLGELSMELGVAAPYMEEAVELLCRSELLRRLDDGRFVTDFFICPKECKSEINEVICDFAEKNHAAIWSLAEKACAIWRGFGETQCEIDDADAKMLFAFTIETWLTQECFPNELWFKFKRDDGGSWGFIGFEMGAESRLEQAMFSWNGSIGSKTGVKVHCYPCVWATVPFGEKRYNDSDSVEKNTLLALKALRKNGGHTDTLSESEMSEVKAALKNGIVVERDGLIIPAAVAATDKHMMTIAESFKDDAEYARIAAGYCELADAAKEIVSRYLAPRFADDLDYYTGMTLDVRTVVAALWKTRGLYIGKYDQFMAICFDE